MPSSTANDAQPRPNTASGSTSNSGATPLSSGIGTASTAGGAASRPPHAAHHHADGGGRKPPPLEPAARRRGTAAPAPETPACRSGRATPPPRPHPNAPCAAHALPRRPAPGRPRTARRRAPPAPDTACHPPPPIIRPAPRLPGTESARNRGRLPRQGISDMLLPITRPEWALGGRKRNDKIRFHNGRRGSRDAGTAIRLRNRDENGLRQEAWREPGLTVPPTAMIANPASPTASPFR